MTKRYYLDAPLHAGEVVTLAKDQMHHLIKVMRVRDLEEIEIVNGKGYVAKAIYQGKLDIQSVEFYEKDKIKHILVLAHSEPKHLDFVLEKTSELGIDGFILFPAKKSTMKSFSASKQERHQKILISAMKQSGRVYLPSISYLKGIHELQVDKHYLLADFNGETFSRADKSTRFIIGPESGFTKEEISYCKDTLHAKGILLSQNVLRTETAAITASVLLSLQ